MGIQSLPTLGCPVCFEKNIDAVVLSCPGSHHLCSSCAVKIFGLIDRSFSVSRKSPCPICNVEVLTYKPAYEFRELVVALCEQSGEPIPLQTTVKLFKPKRKKVKVRPKSERLSDVDMRVQLEYSNRSEPSVQIETPSPRQLNSANRRCHSDKILCGCFVICTLIAVSVVVPLKTTGVVP